MNKRIKRAAGAGLAALAIAVAGGGYYYFHVHTNTPDHAIKKIEQSLHKNDTENFHRFVDVDSLMDSGYNGFVDGITSDNSTLTPDAREAVKNFVQMLRAPMILTMKSALDSYIATGDPNAKENVGVLELMERTGLNGVELRDVKNVEINDADRNEAFADLIVFQPELGHEFPIQLVFARNEDKQWQLVRIKNFQDYVEKINQARRVQLDEYLKQAGEINARHEATIRQAEQKYGSILSLGNLANDDTRAELKTLVENVLKKDWEDRKRELFSLRVPKEANDLHNLYMQTCDVAIAAAQDYSKWLDDRNSQTIKSAEEKIHQVQTLMNDAATMARRMTS